MEGLKYKITVSCPKILLCSLSLGLEGSWSFVAYQGYVYEIPKMNQFFSKKSTSLNIITHITCERKSREVDDHVRVVQTTKCVHEKMWMTTFNTTLKKNCSRPSQAEGVVETCFLYFVAKKIPERERRAALLFINNM
jgi:hypothetical protein